MAVPTFDTYDPAMRSAQVPQEDSVRQLQAHVDAALLLLLTSRAGHGDAVAQALGEVEQAVTCLGAGQPAIPKDAEAAIHAARTELQRGHWDPARAAMVSARGLLVRPNAGARGTNQHVHRRQS